MTMEAIQERQNEHVAKMFIASSETLLFAAAGFFYFPAFFGMIVTAEEVVRQSSLAIKGLNKRLLSEEEILDRFRDDSEPR